MTRRTLDRDEIIRRLKESLPELQDHYGVRTMGLFGSYARHEARKSSDVDLLVEFDRTPSLLTFVELELLLSDRLGIKVDLVMKSALKPGIGKRILSEILTI
ncbi:MAG: hypothetical protein EPO21_18745 [Chloroflexota bacterium]|nr:MAG: hypothetical protein EPO21_18745 [Chloroflexota bacterium]